MNNLEILQKTLLFKGCSRDELELILGMIRERQIRRDTVIFSEKMPSVALCIVKNGAVRITTSAGGEEAGLLLLGPGDFFGELALVHEEVKLVSARAETTVDLLLLTRKDFEYLLDLAPRAASRLLLAISRLLAMRLHANGERLKELLLS